VARLPSATKPAPAQPAVPAKPMSWANRAAAAAAAASQPRPAIPAPKAASPAPSQTRAPPAAQPTQATTPIPASQPVPAVKNTKENEAIPQSQGSGWQTAGSDHAKRQNRPQSVSGPIEKEGTMGYVRYVTEGVGSDELKATLSSYGELIYFDINRSKVCTVRLQRSHYKTNIILELCICRICYHCRLSGCSHCQPTSSRRRADHC
jgi:hypothetical protein